MQTYHATGTCEDGPFAITVQATSPVDAFVEVALSVRGQTRIDTLTDDSGRDVIDDIDPNDPAL
jgi:hypothetical protein